MASLRSGFGRPAVSSLVALLAALVVLLQQMSGAAAFGVSFLQGCPEFNNVTNLDLTYKYLNGSIPPEIGKCTALVSLHLSTSHDVSGQIPSEIGRLSNLRVLKLGSLKLSESIPPEIGNLSQLEELDLSHNTHLSGPIPPELCQLSRLRSLKLANTNLMGPLPDCLGNLARLEFLDLSVTSELHSSGQTLGIVSRLTNLTNLWLHNANLSGSIPSGIGNLTKLQELVLSRNTLSSLASVSLAGLRQLQKLDLSYNNISGPFPTEWLCQLSTLSHLDLEHNNLIGQVPACLANLSGLEYLVLGNNRLSGSIPGELGLLQNLTTFVLGSNQLSGTIPMELARPGQLYSTLDLSGNYLVGPIPPQLVNLTRLNSLDLSQNQLSGLIPAFTNMSSVRILNLGYNNLSGPIPPSLGNLSEVLIGLNLSANQLSGNIPTEFSQLRNLGVLDLGHNNLQGPVTPLSNLPMLNHLTLEHNNFAGTIPPSIFARKSRVFLSHNQFSGPIPPEVSALARPDLTPLYSYLLIDLSSNQLSGSPPLELQQLPTLLQLNLSNNNLSGSFRVGPFGWSPSYSSVLDFSNNAPLAMLPGANLSGMQVVGLPNLTSKDPPPIAPDMRSLRLSGHAGKGSKGLDLSLVPATCPYVTYTRGPVADVTFWDACFSTTGCLVNLVGTGSRLSRATRRTVRLNRISVFLEGAPPYLVFPPVPDYAFDDHGLPLELPPGPYLNNSRGQYFFNDSRFIDKIDLGPGGVAYSGVGFARVQEGNLCGNPEAKTVIAATYSVFAGLILVSSLGWLFVALRSASSKNESSQRKAYVTLGLYLWSIICGLLPWIDLATDVLVVVEVWGAWSAWVLLGSVLLPHFISATCVAWIWWGDQTTNPVWKARFKWIWFADLTDAYPPKPMGGLPAWKYPLALISLPFASAAVIVYDVVAFADKLGFHLQWGEDIYTMQPYFHFRSQLELVLRSIPQVLFQSALYLLGSSRATRIYIDAEIFTLSISLSLVSILVQHNFLLRETIETRVPVVTIVRRRFAAANCRPCLMRRAGETEEVAGFVDQKGAP